MGLFLINAGYLQNHERDWGVSFQGGINDMITSGVDLMFVTKPGTPLMTSGVGSIRETCKENFVETKGAK